MIKCITISKDYVNVIYDKDFDAVVGKTLKENNIADDDIITIQNVNAFEYKVFYKSFDFKIKD